ncbi:hypothetical protein [Pseudaminobacter soli (ex Li et al. 2025)]|uniref:Uncharacterized protein n=1 Tax=Pseudaminobacter soli (ex Li et al. 2025) TaxID=1295366 RepID=A0A2P7SE12_9HYPH|nr:hypothetical protein [Mesorhizobium soli]PSJ60756.1 hypothetical protein C7I85_11990 [Mesorhizobium soli]
MATRKQAAKAAPKPAKQKTPQRSASKAKAVEVAPSAPRTEEHMSIRKISNGYVVRESWTEGKGASSKYLERETFTKTKPTIKI